GDDVLDHGVEGAAEGLVVDGLEGEGDGLGPLVDVGVGVDGAALGSGGAAFEAEKVVHAAMVEELLPHGGDAGTGVGEAAFGPEAGLDGDGVYGGVAEPGVRGVLEVQDGLVFPVGQRPGGGGCGRGEEVAGAGERGEVRRSGEAGGCSGCGGGEEAAARWL